MFKIVKDCYSSNFCQKVIVSGEQVSDRWGRIICDECDNSHPAPMMAVYVSGSFTSEQLALVPGLKCGDIVIER